MIVPRLTVVEACRTSATLSIKERIVEAVVSGLAAVDQFDIWVACKAARLTVSSSLFP